MGRVALCVVQHHTESEQSVIASIVIVLISGEEGLYLLLAAFDACFPPRGCHIGNPSPSVSTIGKGVVKQPYSSNGSQSIGEIRHICVKKKLAMKRRGTAAKN